MKNLLEIAKIFVLAAVIIIPANVSAVRLTSMANGVTAQNFLNNWGFPSAWNSRITIEGPPGLQTFFVLIPAAKSGLPDVTKNTSGFGFVDISIIPNSGEVSGIELILSIYSTNPTQILANAFSAIIGRNNFNSDKNKFDNAVAKVLSRQKDYSVYYSENMNRIYMIALQQMNERDFYKLSVYAFTEN